MEHVWQVVDQLRDQYPILQVDRLPIDVFVFMEVDLGLDPIPFDDLMGKEVLGRAGGQ